MSCDSYMFLKVLFVRFNHHLWHAPVDQRGTPWWWWSPVRSFLCSPQGSGVYNKSNSSQWQFFLFRQDEVWELTMLILDDALVCFCTPCDCHIGLLYVTSFWIRLNTPTDCQVYFSTNWLQVFTLYESWHQNILKCF